MMEMSLQKAQLQTIKGEISSYKTVNVQPFNYDSKLITPGKVGRVSVVMYSTTWYRYCKKASAHVKRKNIKFTEYDVEKSAKGKNDYKRLEGRGVQAILIEKRRMNGFSAKSFDSIYSSQL
jgi:mycoredoxin